MLTYQDLANEACAKFTVVDNNRMARAILIAEKQTSMYNQKCPRGFMDVRSDGDLGWYRVSNTHHTCTCKDSRKGHICKHRLAVWLRVEMLCRPIAEERNMKVWNVKRELGYV